MEYLSTASAGAARVANPFDSGLLAKDWRLARSAHVNLFLSGIPRVNVLLIGINGGVWSHLETLLPDLDEPVTTWSQGQKLVLPPPERTGTMILHEVGSLPHADQLRMLEWLELTAGRTQVVSTSSSPMLPRVESCAFNDTLYYRLNIVCVDLTS
jgi:sigma-54-interacting transcriptional regulator